MTVQQADRAQFDLPTSELARAADAPGARVSPPLVYNHCVRAHLYAREVAKAEGLRPGVDYDDELVYLGSILHDGFDLVDSAGWGDRPVRIGGDSVGAGSPAELATLFTTHFNAGDLDALMALYEPAALLFSAPGESRAGTEAIRAALGEMIGSGATIELRPRRLHVAGELAMISNDAVVSGAGPDGAAVVSTSTEIARRGRDGSWRYVLDDPYFSA
ncbi:nuclear transport factor 2 family protein [Nocardia cyriacigeorgica]|uniref:nuclear transport factor 2 family protein n=1 Tax=Nocardia cyriacigeorgica TaxID=135487 RepID=UPI002453A778|nr:nuclear transport factor 2 family protein [Nocardia cyriacigeorgica]